LYAGIIEYFRLWDNLISIQNSEVNNNRNAITKWSVGQHRPPTNAKVGSGAVEE
jgi:hypothetical protein